MRTRRARRSGRLLALSMGAVLLPQCAPRCTTPAPPAPAAVTISFDGRPPLEVVAQATLTDAGLRAADRVLSAGLAVDIDGNTDPGDGYAHVAAHYSTFGAPFRAAAKLGNGDTITYAGATFKVVGRSRGHAGDVVELRPGLTVQYSGCGGVCLVFADPM